MYGPTEATCGATIKHLRAHQPVTIGVPNPSTRIYILDDSRNLSPRGVTGEIYLAGVQVSRGYIGNSQETASSFIPDSICVEKGGFMYKTGDRGYWNSNGELVYIGRTDRQNKLRGFRLDLNDLETRISRSVPSATAVAITKKDDILVGMLRPASLNIHSIRSLIMTVLPHYAVPRYLAAVDHFPTTVAGKTDYAAIAEFNYVTSPVLAAAPRERDLSTIQERIAHAWISILNISADTIIQQDTSFWDLGGNSIQMLLLSHRLTKEFRRVVPMNLLLEANTLLQLANAIEGAQSISPLVESKKDSYRSLGEHDLSPMEHEWWSRYLLTQETSCFNVSFVCSLKSEIDRWKLTTAWNTTLSRHKILRCRYVETGTTGPKKEYAGHPPCLQRVRAIDIDREINLPFNLSRDHLIRVLLSKSLLVVVASHIVCDLTTMRLLLQEVASSYSGNFLKPVTTSYGTICSHKTQQPSAATFAFWEKYLRNPPLYPDSKIGTFSRQKSLYHGTSTVFQAPPEIFRTMTEFTSISRLTFHQLLLASVALVLTYDSKDHDVIVGAPYLNRDSGDEMETVGLFLQPLPIRIRYPGPTNTNDKITSTEASLKSHNLKSSSPLPTIDPYLLAVRQASRAALSHPIAWHQLLSHLKIKPEYPNQPLFDVMVTFHERETNHWFPISEATPLYAWSRGAKFKLMVEAQAISADKLMVRLEYDEGCLSKLNVSRFQRMAYTGVRGLQ